MSHTKVKKKKRPKKERIIIVVSIVVCIVAVLAVLFTILYESKLFAGKNGGVKNNNLINSDIDDLNGNNLDKFKSSTSENILLCGLDESEQLTDVIMVVNLNYKEKKINVLQIPRDTYVESGAGSTKKINSAYSSGDKNSTPINRLIYVINEQFQLKIDHYATINLKSFRKVIDAIGGVPIDIPYDIGNAQLGVIKKGQQTLNGEQAEWLVRHRHTYYDQDIGRIKIQRLFLASVVQQVKKIGISQVMKLIPAIFGNFTTDLSVKEVQNYAKIAFSIDLSNMTFYMVPGEGTTTPNGQSVWTIHKYETADMLNKYFRTDTDPVSAEDLKIVELAHTGEYYENTEDDISDLLDGTKPGMQKNEDSLPAYTHVVTNKPKVTTKVTTSTTTSSKVVSSETVKTTTTDEEVVVVVPETNSDDSSDSTTTVTNSDTLTN